MKPSIKLLGVYPSKDLHQSRDHMKFWFGLPQSLKDRPSSAVLNYTVMKEELRKQKKALTLFRRVEELVCKDFPDGVVTL